MRDNADLARRVALVKQALLVGLKHANAAALDGTSDDADQLNLSTAYEHACTAKDALDQLRRRIDFHLALDRVRNGEASDESSRFLVSMMRRGVDGGYPVEEVRRMIDEALGRPPDQGGALGAGRTSSEP